MKKQTRLVLWALILVLLGLVFWVIWWAMSISFMNLMSIQWLLYAIIQLLAAVLGVLILALFFISDSGDRAFDELSSLLNRKMVERNFINELYLPLNRLWIILTNKENKKEIKTKDEEIIFRECSVLFFILEELTNPPRTMDWWINKLKSEQGLIFPLEDGYRERVDELKSDPVEFFSLMKKVTLQFSKMDEFSKNEDVVLLDTFLNTNNVKINLFQLDKSKKAHGSILNLTIGVPIATIIISIIMFIYSYPSIFSDFMILGGQIDVFKWVIGGILILTIFSFYLIVRYANLVLRMEYTNSEGEIVD